MSTQQAGPSGQATYSAAGGTTVQSEASRPVVVLGYICAVLVPLVGFIIGAVLATKHKGTANNPGTGIMATAGAVFVVGMLLIAAAGSGA